LRLRGTLVDVDLAVFALRRSI